MPVANGPGAADEAERLRDGIEFLGLAADARQLQQLVDFSALVRKWNKAFNLVSRQDIDRLVSRHVVDSLSVAPLLEEVEGTILDLGSGAGFPGVPLAILYPQRSFHLCDRMARRTRFLQQAITALQLANVEVLASDAAALPGNGQYGVVLARAVATVDMLWAMVEDMLTDAGRLIVFRSTQPEAAAPDDADRPLPDGVRTRTRELAVSTTARHTVLEAGRW